MKLVSRCCLVAALALSCVACDRATKLLAVSRLRGHPPVELLHRTVRLEYAENVGAWGSLGASWSPPVRTLSLVVLPLLVLGGLAIAVLRRRESSPTELAALGLILGGGVGNLADRVAHGGVVDFLYVGRGWLATNVFNVADVALVAGIGLLLLASRRRAGPPRAPPPG
jgi:signal peptidase II